MREKEVLSLPKEVFEISVNGHKIAIYGRQMATYGAIVQMAAMEGISDPLVQWQRWIPYGEPGGPLVAPGEKPKLGDRIAGQEGGTIPSDGSIELKPGMMFTVASRI